LIEKIKKPLMDWSKMAKSRIGLSGTKRSCSPSGTRRTPMILFWGAFRIAECTEGAATTFDQARAEFEQAWQVYLSKRTEADLQWRDDRDWTARKYGLWDAGKRLEPPSYGPGKVAAAS
jgi:hypothetical protein